MSRQDTELHSLVQQRTYGRGPPDKFVTCASRSASRWRLSSRVALDTSTSPAHGSFSPLQIGKQMTASLMVAKPHQLAA